MKSSNTLEVLKTEKRPIQRHKLYKAKKKWVSAIISGSTLAAVTFTFTNVASADVTQQNESVAVSTNSTTTDTFSPASTTSAVSNSQVAESKVSTANTITQPVHIDHSDLDAAVNQAKQAGLDVQQASTTSQTVSLDQVDAAKKNIQNSYSQQQQVIEDKVKTANTEKANYQNNNGAKGDTTQLDSKIKEGQSVPGLTIVKDQDQVTIKKASDTQGIQDALNNATKSNNEQAQNIQDAIDTQKRNNTEYDNAMEQYNQQLQDYKNKMNWQNVLFSSQILQALKLVPEPNAKAKIDLLLPTSSDLNSYGVEYHQPGEEYIASAIGDKSSGAVRLDQTGESLLHVTNAQAGKDFARVTYTGLQNSMWAGHHISKIIATYSQLTDVYGIGNKDANGNPIGYIAISNDPYYGTFTYGLGGFAIDYQYYDENGNRINFGDQNDGAGAWFSIGSLNSSGPTGRVESVQLQSPGRLYQLAGSKVGVYSNVSMTNPIPDSTGKSGDYAYSPESTLPDDWDSTLGLNDPNAYIGATVAHVTGDHVKFSFFTQGNHNNMWAYPSTIVPVTPGPSRPVRKTSEAHYRYNPVKVLPPSTIGEKVTYQLHELNVQTTPEKNWVEGHTNVNSKVAINDDIVSARVDFNHLSANDIQGGISTLQIADNYSKYAPNVDYAGAQVFEDNQDKTSAYTIKDTGSQVIATRNNPSEANGGQVSLVVDFKIKPGVKTGTVFENSGSATINDKTVETPDVNIKTYEQETAKHWMEGKNIVDDKIKVNDDTVDTQVSMSLPEQSTLVSPLSYISVEDNYSDFADKTQLLTYKVFENDKDATDQYNITNENGHLTAVRKNAAGAPAGQVILKATFKINADVQNGTNLVNRGSGRINNHTVETNQPKIVTFTQDVNKHWIENNHVVDTKVAIADDVVTTRINSTLPDVNNLAAPLTYLSIDDDYTDFMNSAVLQSWQVLENNNDVTDQYDVKNENGHLTAVRKNAAGAPAGQLSLVAKFKINDNVKSGTKLTNTGSSRINNHTVSANKPYIITYTQSADKHWVDQNVVVDDKTYVDGDDVTGSVTMSLPNHDTLIKALENVVIRDNYFKFSQYVSFKNAVVLENDKDVSNQYDIKDENGVVTATRKNAAETPSGKVQLKVTWTTHDAIPTGTKLVNSGSGTINNKTVNTPDRTIYTFYNSSDKHWVAGERKVDSLTRINDDLIHAEITTQLPNPSDLGHKLETIQLVDDWSNFKDKAKITGYHVFENDRDASDQYNIVVDNNGFVTATRKDASTAPGGTAKLIVDWQINHDVKAGTALKNTGYTLVNKSKVNVPTVDTITYTPQTDKHWVENNVTVDDKTYVSGDAVHGDVSMSLPDSAKLAEPLTNVTVKDDYTDFKDKVSYQSAHVFENDKDVTQLYTISNENGVVTATRKDPVSAPSGNVHLKVDWKLNSNLPNGTVLTNKGSGQLNSNLVPTPDRKIKVFTQDGEKHWSDNGAVVDSKTAINDDTISSNISMTLPNKDSLAKSLEKVQIQDDYTDFVKNVGQPDVKMLENDNDVTGEYNITIKDGLITATRKNPADTPSGNLVMKVTWKINHDVKSGTQFKNKGIGTINNNTIKTNVPDIQTYTPATDKHWTNDEKQIVDNKVFIAGDTVSSQVSMTIPETDKLAHKLTKVVLIDDFADFADKADLKDYSVTEGGEIVTDQYNIEVTKDHQIIATRKNPANAVSNSMAILHATWTLHKDIPTGTVLTNKGSGQLNNDLVPTPDRQIKTYTQDAEKHWINKGGQVVDHKIAINDDNVTASVNMTLPKADEFGGKITKIQLSDDFSKFAKYVDITGVHVYENNHDVTDKYNISIDKNGKVVATRKNPEEILNAMNNSSSTLNPAPAVSMKTDMTAKQALDVNKLSTNATGSFNNLLFTLPNAAVTSNAKNDTVVNVSDSSKSSDSSAVIGQENNGSVQSYVSTANGQVKAQTDLELPENGNDLKNVSITNDYSKYSKYVDSITPEQVHVYEDGTEATGQYSLKDDGKGHLTATRNDAENLNGGRVSMSIDFKLKDNIPDGTKLENIGYGTINDNTIKTNTPSITTFTQKAEKHWVDQDVVVDGKVFINGTTVKTKVTTTVPDSAQLTDGLTYLELKDDYSKFKQYVDLNDAQVLENGKEVTDEYDIKREDGIVTAIRKDPSKAAAGNAQLILSFKIHADVPTGTKLVNQGFATINNHTVKTNTPDIETFLPQPTKDVVISVDNQNSLNGKKIELNQSFDYKLVGTTVPKNTEKLDEYGFHDDYDQQHDQYNGGYIVLLNDDVTLKDGTVLKGKTDVTKYTTQVIDTKDGKVDIEFDKDFLSKVDLNNSSFGATAYLKMKRIKSGEVQNKYNNTINNQSFTSNTVTTTTDEPKKSTPTPETPKTPEVSETPNIPTSNVTPSVPVQTGTPTQVAYTPQLQTPEVPLTTTTPQKSLPQTGNDHQEMLAILGLAALGVVGTIAVGSPKKRFEA